MIENSDIPIYDAAVIGAGPAGSAAAFALARFGWKTALIEKEELGRGRVCGGFLGAEGTAVLRRLGLEDVVKEARGFPVHELILSDPRHPEIRTPFSNGGSFGVDRSVFDLVLAKKAEAAGADLFDRSAAEIEERPGSPALLKLNGKVRLIAHKIIDAAGRRRPRVMTGKTFFALKTIYQGLSEMEGRVALHFVRKGHVGFNQMDGTHYTMCLYIERTRMLEAKGDMDLLMAMLSEENPSIGRHLKGARRTGPWTGCPAQPDYREAFYDGRRFFTGDALSMANPIIGGGLSLALGGACVLAETLEDARSGGDSDKIAARLYEMRWKARYARKMTYGRVLGRIERSDFFSRLVFSILHRSSALVERLVSASRPHFDPSDSAVEELLRASP